MIQKKLTIPEIPAIRWGTYDEIKNGVKELLLSDAEEIEIASPYELSMLNNYILASNENIESEYNLGQPIKLKCPYLDGETDMIGHNPVEMLWDIIHGDFNTLYDKWPG